jgi:hypothetical protein
MKVKKLGGGRSRDATGRNQVQGFFPLSQTKNRIACPRQPGYLQRTQRPVAFRPRLATSLALPVGCIISIMADSCQAFFMHNVKYFPSNLVENQEKVDSGENGLLL